MKKRLIQFSLLLCLMALMCVTAGATGTDTPPDSGFRNVSKETAYENSITLKPLTADGTEVTESNGDFPGALKMRLVYQNPQSGSEYLLFVLSGTETVPSVDNMAYIEQQSAVASTVEYVIYPKKLPAGTTSVTYSVYMSSNASADSSSSASGQVTEYVKVASFEYYSASNVKMGDLDENGEVEAVDARIALQIGAQLLTATEKQQIAGDIDGDNNVSAIDARRILVFAAKLSDTL